MSCHGKARTYMAKVYVTDLAGDTFSWNQNAFNFQATELESIKMTRIGINFIYLIGI